MPKTFTRSLWIILLTIITYATRAQQPDRVQIIQDNLEVLSVKVPGLKKKVELSVTGISLQDYLRALSRTNKLNISVDQRLSFTIYDSFNNISASDIITFLARKYNLEVNIIGAIIYILPYAAPALNNAPLVKQVKVQYSQLNNTLSMELDNDSLPAVAKKITQVSGKNVVVPAGLQDKRITAFISGAPFDAAVEKMAFTNQLKMVRTRDDFYLLQPLEENEEVYVTGDKNTSVRRTFKPNNTGVPSNSGLYSRVVGGEKLISAEATNANILDLVKQASYDAGKNYSLYSDIKGTISLKVTDVTYENFLNILFKGTEYTFHPENGIYLIGERRMEGLRTFKVIQLQHRSIDTIMTMIPADWKRNMEIREFREQNSLLLSGSSAHIAEVEAFIKQLDVLVPVVLIEVTLVDIRKVRNITTGISAGISDSVKTGGKVFPGLDYTFGAKAVNGFLKDVGRITSTNIGRVTPNFYVKLSALEENENVDIRSVPKLSALNGHTAKLSIGSTRTYKNTTQNVFPTAINSQTVFTNQYVETEANLSIGIKPVVSGDDQVTLGINIDISDFLSFPTDGSPPPKSSSKFETSLRVNNEDMIVLGGIERTENSDSGSGVPFLSRIPVLKWLFSSRSKKNVRVVTVVFIKSTIMR